MGLRAGWIRLVLTKLDDHSVSRGGVQGLSRLHCPVSVAGNGDVQGLAVCCCVVCNCYYLFAGLVRAQEGKPQA